MTRELQDGLVWYYCGLDKPPSRDTIDRFLTDLEHVIDDVFDQLVKQAAIVVHRSFRYTLSCWPNDRTRKGDRPSA